MILSYQQALIDQSFKRKSGLWVLPSGLGLYTIVEHLLWQLEKNNASSKLIIVMNLEHDPVFDHFQSFPPHRFRLINSQLTADQR